MDEQYIDEILKGNTEAYSFLVEKYKKYTYSLAYRIVRNNEDAEEIAQDAFIKAYKSLKQFNRKSKFSTWLYKIVYNTAISKLRKKKIEISDIYSETIENTNTIDNINGNSNLETSEKKKFIEKALNNLPYDENILITLYYLNEKSIDEIKQITNYSIPNIKVKLHRARKKLYAELKLLLKDELISLH
ncbi:MAG: RNA polymerase sigma factor [Bacteroidales bacterium]|nr:RNA polymerase sigma factor [Bacteroidales bacterium]